MMTRTDRRRFPILFAAIAALALAMALLFSTVQAQEGSAPDKPTGLSATATHDSVVLTWDDPGDDTITGYVILRRVRVNDTGGEFSELVADTGTAATTYTDDSVKANTTYTYRIKATNEHGVSERSRWFHIDIPAAPERPDKPRGLDATATHDQVVLTWDEPGDDTITGYVILRRNRDTDRKGEFRELVADTGTAATTYTDDTVVAETTYTYRIKAINEHGVSERSRWSHINVPAAPEAVEGDDPDGEDGGGAPGHATPPGPGKRANVSEGGTDLPANPTTTGQVEVGSSVTGNIGSFADRDYFRVVLEAGTRYQIDLEGAPTGRGTLADPALTLYDESEDNLLDDVNSGIGANSRGIFTPTTAGTYYLRVADFDETDTGTYTLSVIVLGANGASEADTDFPGTTATTGRVDVGASVTGNRGSIGDTDWFAVDLEAGKTYQIDQKGEYSGVGTLEDPYLDNIRDSSGNQISSTFNNDVDFANGIFDSQIIFTPTAAGTYYLVAFANGLVTGTYTLSVRDITPMLSTDATLSALSLGPGVTLSPAFASGTVTYTASVANSVDEVTVTVTENHASADSEIQDADGNALADADDNAADFQVALSVGDTVIKVKVTAADGTSTQTYTVTVTRDDFPNDNTTTGEVEVGGTVTGNIGTVGDYDRFKVELEAGTRYQLDLEGADTGRGTLADPHLGLYDNIGSQLQGDNGQQGDDNSGVGANARMIYTPAASGDFYPVVTEINDNLTGTYTLSVILLGANGASEADTDFPADNTTSGRVEVGASATGNIGIANDYDWFRVDLEAGKTYQIDLKGIGGGGGTLGNPYLLNIRDSSGTEIDGTENDDVDPSNDIYDSQTVYTPTAAGTYYLVAVSGVTGGTGTYTLSVRDITTPPCTLNTGDIWCGAVTVAEIKTADDALVGHGFADGAGLSAGGLAGYPDATMFSVGDNDYTISAAYIQVPTGTTLTGTLYVLLSADLTDDDKAGLVLTVDDTTTTFAFSGATKGTTGLYSWGLSGLTWSAGDTVTIRVRRPRTLSVADASDAENDGEVEFTVTLSEAATEEVTATWTASIKTGDTAAAADLGSMKTGTVTVAIGDTTETFTVPVVNDATDEGDETFTVTLSSPSSNVKLETDPTAKGTIEDDDPTPTVTVANAAATEGDAVEFVVTLSAVSGRDVMVDYATSVATGDDATSGVDFTTKSGTLTIAAADNTASGTIEVQTTEDDASESAETFTLTISNPDNATLTTDTTATGTINNRATAAAALVGNTTQTTTFEQTTVGSISFAVGFQIGDDDGGYALTALDLMFSAKPVVPVTVSLWDGYRPGGNDDGDDDWRPNNKYFEFDNPSAFKDGNNQINTFTPPEPFYLHDDRVYFVVIESDGSGSTEYYITNTDADGQSRVDSNWWILNSAVRYQDLSNPDDPWPDSVTQTPTRIPVFTIHGYDLDRLTYTTSESDQDNFKVGEDNYNWWAQSFNVIQGADSFIGFKLHSVALALEYIASADSGIPDSPDEIIVSLYTGKQEGGGDPVPDEKLFDFRDPPAFREGHDNAFTAPEGTTLRPQGRYAIVIQRLSGGWIRLRNTASNDQDGNSNIFVANESQKSRDGTNWSGENWVVKMLVYGKQRTEAIPLSTGPTTLSGLSLGTGVTLSPAFASGTVTYTASVANSVDEVTVTPTTNHASATVEILDTDDNELDDADDMEDDFQVALSVGDTVIKVKVTAEDSTATQTYTVTVTRDDFPNDNTTTGEVEVGGSVTGAIKPSTDKDWFKVELEAGTRYQFDVEGADTGRGTLPDPAASLYATSLISGNDDAGVGKNARIINTPTATGTYYVVADSATSDTGTYTLSVIVLGANGASEADTDFPADNTTSGRVEVGASATGNIASTSDKDWFRVDLEAGKTYQIDLEGSPTGRGSLGDPFLQIFDASGSNKLAEDDDISTANLNSQLVFTPTAAGAYYLVVETAAPTTGTYTLSVREITQPPPCTLNTGDIWCGAVTVAEIKTSPADALVGHGFADGAGLSAGSLAGNPDETVFSVGDNDYTIQGAYVQVPTGTTPTGTLYVLLTADLTDDDKAGLLLTVDGAATPFEFSGATKSTTGLYSWGLSGLTWSAGDTVTIRVRPRTLSVADASDAENDGEVEFTVTLSEAAATAVTATWTASIEAGDTAVAADLGATKTGTVTVAIGDTTGTFEVPVVNDATEEGDETFTVTLSSPSSNAKLETDPTATGTIEDDDATALSTDATLSGLSLGMGVTLSPAFASGTAIYTASVANSVDEVTVTPTTNHASATVEILDTDDNELDDADDMEDDFQVALEVGDTVIKVKVTAEDDTSTQTYTVTVTRAAEMTPDDPPDDSGNVPEPVTDLLSNLGQATNTNFALAIGTFENAQGFTTGSDSYGYFLASINLDVNAVPKTPADVTVSLWSATSDSPPEPDAAVATLTHSTGTWATGVNTFNAPGGTVLDPGTTYFVVASYSGARAHLQLRPTASGSADDDSTGWSVAGARLTRNRTDVGDWLRRGGEYTKFSVSGAAVPAQGVAEGATDLPTNVSEPDGEDLPEGITTTGRVEVGGSVTGEIAPALDVDWFAVELKKGKRYQFDVEGADTGRGNLADPHLWGLQDAGGQAVSGARSNDGGVGKNGRVINTPDAEGTYYIAVAGADSTTGTYTLSVIVLGANGASEADTDFPRDTTTTGRVEVGASATGNIDPGEDLDGFRVDLEAGKRYRFDLEGADTGRGSQADPILALYGDSFNVSHYIDEDDDGGEGLNSRLTYTATATGIYHLEVAGLDPGTYTLSVREILLAVAVPPGGLGPSEIPGAVRNVSVSYSPVSGIGGQIVWWDAPDETGTGAQWITEFRIYGSASEGCGGYLLDAYEVEHPGSTTPPEINGVPTGFKYFKIVYVGPVKFGVAAVNELGEGPCEEGPEPPDSP